MDNVILTLVTTQATPPLTTTRQSQPQDQPAIKGSTSVHFMTSASPNFPNPCDKGSAWLCAVPVGTVVTRFYDPCYALFPKLSILRWKDQLRKESLGDNFLAIATNKSPQKTRHCLIYHKRAWFNPVRFPDPPLK